MAGTLITMSREEQRRVQLVLALNDVEYARLVADPSLYGQLIGRTIITACSSAHAKVANKSAAVDVQEFLMQMRLIRRVSRQADEMDTVNPIAARRMRAFVSMTYAGLPVVTSDPLTGVVSGWLRATCASVSAARERVSEKRKKSDDSERVSALSLLSDAAEKNIDS